MKILLAGGGTGGSVTPLLAVAKEIRERSPEADFLFLGTRSGPEENMVKFEHMEFDTISAGKLRRYRSWHNLFDIFLIIHGFFQALLRLRLYKPDVIFAAGSYVSVPVIWAGWFLRIPSLIHQQDIRPGLANRLVQGMATKISVTFEDSLDDFPRKKSIWTGNPIREDILSSDRKRGQALFGLEPELPTVLVFGGGAGSQRINDLMMQAVLKLTKSCQILHIYGKRKSIYKINDSRYHGYQFLSEEMDDAYAVADIVVCRAGLGSLTEIAALGKAAVIIPMPDTHQVENADIYKKANAAVVLDEPGLDSDFLVNVISGLMANDEWRRIMQKNIESLVKIDARKAISDIIISLVKKQDGSQNS